LIKHSLNNTLSIFCFVGWSDSATQGSCWVSCFDPTYKSGLFPICTRYCI